MGDPGQDPAGKERWLDEPWTQKRMIGRTGSFNAVHEISVEEAKLVALTHGAGDEGANWANWWINRRLGRSSTLGLNIYELTADEVVLLSHENPRIGKSERLKTVVDPEAIRRWGRPIPQFGMLIQSYRTERGQRQPPNTQVGVIMPPLNIQQSAPSSRTVQRSSGAKSMVIHEEIDRPALGTACIVERHGEVSQSVAANEKPRNERQSTFFEDPIQQQSSEQPDARDGFEAENWTLKISDSDKRRDDFSSNGGIDSSKKDRESTKESRKRTENPESIFASTRPRSVFKNPKAKKPKHKRGQLPDFSNLPVTGDPSTKEPLDLVQHESEMDPKDSHTSRSDRAVVLDRQEDMLEKVDDSNGSQILKAVDELGNMTKGHKHPNDRSSSRGHTDKAKFPIESQTSEAVEGPDKQMTTELHHSNRSSSSNNHAETANDLKASQTPRAIDGHNNTNKVEASEVLDEHNNTEGKGMDLHEVEASGAMDKPDAFDVPGESGNAATITGRASKTRKKQGKEKKGKDKDKVNTSPLDAGSVDGVSDNQDSQNNENEYLSTPSPTPPSLNSKSQGSLFKCIHELHHTVTSTLDLFSALNSATLIDQFQGQVFVSLIRLEIRILTAEHKLSTSEKAQNSDALELSKRLYTSGFTRLIGEVPVLAASDINFVTGHQNLFERGIRFLRDSVQVLGNHCFPGCYGAALLSINRQQAKTTLDVSQDAILTAEHDLSNCEISEEGRAKFQQLINGFEALLKVIERFLDNPENAPSEERAKFQKLIDGFKPLLEVAAKFLDETMSTHTQISLPLPVLPEGWSAEKDFKAFGALSAATQRSIEPVGPHFLAHARRARHKRTFSEDDRIQAQENVKKVEDDDAGEISEPEDPMMLSRDAKDWKGQDHYAVLGLSKYRYKATEEQIKRAHRKKVLRHHPDKKAAAGNTEDDSFFKCIQKASEILLDPVKRRQFDSVDEAADVEPPTKKQTKDGKFYKLWSAVFKAEGRFSKDPLVPKFGDENSTKEEVEHFYNFFYNFDSWRSFEYQDEDVPDDNENRDQKRHVEKKNNNARKKKKTEDSARLRKLLDDAQAGDERIKKFRQEANASKNKKRLEKEAAEKKAIEDAKAKKAAEAQAAKEAEEAAKAEREQGKKAKEAAKAAVKKNRRVLKGSVKDANYFVSGEPPAAAIDSVLGDVELIQGKIDPDETASLAGKLNGLKIVDEIKTVWQTEVKRLVDAGKIKDSDIKTLA